MAPPLRRATRDDHDAIVRVLVRAFDADPMANYLIRQDRHRARGFELAFSTLLRHMTMPHGETWVADGGVALWTPPGAWEVTMLRTLAMGPSLIRATGLANVLKNGRAMGEVQKRHPRAPHFYLFAIGVDPDHQGRGIGSALLREVLVRCDEQRVGAYLEASTPANQRLYARHGFKVTEELLIAPEAPPCWLMWRDPSPP